MRLTPEILMIEKAATALNPFLGDLVFVGGSVVALLISDPAAALPRATKDVDVLVQVATRVEYYKIEDKMRECGFSQSIEERVICRWAGHGLVVDVMPTNEDVLGFSNIWYESAFISANFIELPSGAKIRVINAPHFLATKLVAFADRGNNDLYLSHDLEDIILVVDGRPEITEELHDSPEAVRGYVNASIAKLLAQPEIRDAVEGHLGSAENSESRLPTTMNRLDQLARTAQV